MSNITRKSGTISTMQWYLQPWNLFLCHSSKLLSFFTLQPHVLQQLSKEKALTQLVWMNVECHEPDHKNIYVKKRRDISIYILKLKTMLVDEGFLTEREREKKKNLDSVMKFTLWKHRNKEWASCRVLKLRSKFAQNLQSGDHCIILYCNQFAQNSISLTHN